VCGRGVDVRGSFPLFTGVREQIFVNLEIMPSADIACTGSI